MKSAIFHNTLLALITMVLLGADAAANTITLRTSVRLTSETGEVYLSDIAEIQGEEAGQYANVKIAVVSDPEQAVELHVRQVRQALDAAEIHWGRVNLNGSRVLVRPRGRSMASPPMAMAGAAVADEDAARTERRGRASRDPILADEVVQSRTLRGAIAEFLVAALDLKPEHLRLEFAGRDDDALDASLEEHRFEIEPVSSVHSNRVDLAVRVWEEGMARERITVRVSPTIYMPIVRMKRDVSRGSVVNEDDIEVTHEWIQPVHGGLVTREQDAVGRIATIRLSEGDSLRDQHVRRETLIRRGELVIVRALVGGSVLTIQAEARANGSKGDQIEFRKAGERDTFLATVAGRNEAVIDMQR